MGRGAIDPASAQVTGDDDNDNGNTDNPNDDVASKARRKPIATKPFTPVRRDMVKQVNKRAANILAETVTRLLRSAEPSDRRMIASAQMARTVGSNKTLLHTV